MATQHSNNSHHNHRTHHHHHSPLHHTSLQRNRSSSSSSSGRGFFFGRMKRVVNNIGNANNRNSSNSINNSYGHNHALAAIGIIFLALYGLVTTLYLVSSQHVLSLEGLTKSNTGKTTSASSSSGTGGGSSMVASSNGNNGNVAATGNVGGIDGRGGMKTNVDKIDGVDGVEEERVNTHRRHHVISDDSKVQHMDEREGRQAVAKAKAGVVAGGGSGGANTAGGAGLKRAPGAFFEAGRKIARQVGVVGGGPGAAVTVAVAGNDSIVGGDGGGGGSGSGSGSGNGNGGENNGGGGGSDGDGDGDGDGDTAGVKVQSSNNNAVAVGEHEDVNSHAKSHGGEHEEGGGDVGVTEGGDRHIDFEEDEDEDEDEDESDDDDAGATEDDDIVDPAEAPDKNILRPVQIHDNLAADDDNMEDRGEDIVDAESVEEFGVAAPEDDGDAKKKKAASELDTDSIVMSANKKTDGVLRASIEKRKNEKLRRGGRRLGLGR